MEESYEYDAHKYLIASVNLPIVAQILEASKEKPYLSLKLNLDQREIAKMMVDSNLPMPRKSQADRGLAVSEVSLPLLKSFTGFSPGTRGAVFARLHRPGAKLLKSLTNRSINQPV